MGVQESDYISVSEYAELVGVTSQTVYNMIRSHSLDVLQFNRGSRNGWLIKKPIMQNSKDFSIGDKVLYAGNVRAMHGMYGKVKHIDDDDVVCVVDTNSQRMPKFWCKKKDLIRYGK